MQGVYQTGIAWKDTWNYLIFLASFWMTIASYLANMFEKLNVFDKELQEIKYD